jgi:hypothetical protein
LLETGAVSGADIAVVVVVFESIQPAEIAMAKKAATTAPPRSAEANGVRRVLFIVRAI